MSQPIFSLQSDYTPRGHQPQAISQLVDNIFDGVQDQILLGVTGSGKTFTMANTIARCNRPALILAPNKTLAAQLYNEFKVFFPHNAVEYFVSYYDYYQPEAYVPTSDTYIEKDSSINDNIDKLRHGATHALLTRRDVIIVASVSCIYGLGSPEYYSQMVIPIAEGQHISMDALMGRLIEVQYERNDYDFHRGTFRVRGDVLEVIPAYRHEVALRIEFFGDDIEAIHEIDSLTGEVLGKVEKTVLYPASHYVSAQDNLKRAMGDIRDELGERLRYFQEGNKLVEAQRLEQRTQLDLEMLEELGYCNGVENYTRHLDGRKEGEPPHCLINYFPKDFLLFVDESHISVSQVGAMYKGDRSRKQTLVDFGFRLPSALDNRPLQFNEFQNLIGQAIYVSATPGKWEIEQSQGIVTEQIIRPTGLLDPLVDVRPTKGQMEDLLGECKARIAKDERVLVTTLTKRMAEDLTEYCLQMGVKTRYLHSDIDTLERMQILKALRLGEFDVLVGINLLREGLDLPEVSLVAILDADKEGFLRSEGSLIQTFGRAARNAEGQVILYADKVTRSMKAAMDETARRRTLQEEWNAENGIEPKTIRKSVDTHLDGIFADAEGSAGRGRGKGKKQGAAAAATSDVPMHLSVQDMARQVQAWEKEMRDAARNLEFEQAAVLRDKIKKMQEMILVAS